MHHFSPLIGGFLKIQYPAALSGEGNKILATCPCGLPSSHPSENTFFFSLNNTESIFHQFRAEPDGLCALETEEKAKFYLLFLSLPEETFIAAFQ